MKILSLFQYMYSHGDINGTNSLNIFINEASHGTDPNVLRTVIRDENDTLDNQALEFDISGIVGDGVAHLYTDRRKWCRIKGLPGRDSTEQ